LLKLILKSCLLLSAAVLLVIVAGYTSAPTLAAGYMPQDSSNPVKSTAVSREKAKKMYAVDCAVCHGDTGDGKADLAKDMGLTMDDWTDPKALAGKSDQELFDIIRKGKDKMPPEDASRAKDSEVWGLVNYIRGFAKSQPAAPAAPTN
jgi:mono/diheme cytochrome c family protein